MAGSQKSPNKEKSNRLYPRKGKPTDVRGKSQNKSGEGRGNTPKSKRK